MSATALARMALERKLMDVVPNCEDVAQAISDLIDAKIDAALHGNATVREWGEQQLKIDKGE